MALQAAMDFLGELARGTIAAGRIEDYVDLERAASAAGFPCSAAEIDQAFLYVCLFRERHFQTDRVGPANAK